MTEKKKLNCAVYTRKSTDEGLDQEYNSLDAQRDAGEAYIRSQKHEGWQLVKKRYDDGGFSGGTLERPALKQLLHDVETGKVDVIVVYKVDRLSRSLHDFAKLVEIFDKHNVSFVSVTQAFNTTNSMGRLTLNILLSFAQFERELTGERIRDKFASSKKKGIWMGGRPTLGYDVKDRKLVVNETEAKKVRFAYEEYLQKDSIYDLLALLKEKDIRTKSWTTQKGRKVTGGNYTTSTVYDLLRNPIYIGKLKHKKEIYDGEHSGIVDPEVWQKVQEKLENRSVRRTGGKHDLKEYLLRGKVLDANGNKLTTGYGTKKSKGIKIFTRYYINKQEAVNGYVSGNIRHVNADELEQVTDRLLLETLKNNEKLAENWPNIVPSQKAEMIKMCVRKVGISEGQIRAEFSSKALQEIEEKYKQQRIDFVSSSGELHHLQNNKISVGKQEGVTICSVKYIYKNYGGKKLITDDEGKEIRIGKTHKNSSLIAALITSAKCNKMLETGEANGIMDLVKKLSRDRSYISKILRFNYLSPKIKAAILDGTQPRTASIQSLTLITTMHWPRQEKAFGL